MTLTLNILDDFLLAFFPACLDIGVGWGVGWGVGGMEFPKPKRHQLNEVFILLLGGDISERLIYLRSS